MDNETGIGRNEEEGSQIARELGEWLPSRGDRLFVTSDQGHRLDPLGFTVPGEQRRPTSRWQLYSSGFLHAADRLVEGCGDHAHEDELIYPILSLYRHHLELELKYVLRCCPACNDQLRQWLKTKHSLVALWNKIHEVYPRFDEWTNKECTDACQSLITEFDQHDPTSQAGRYPEDQRNNQTLDRLNIVDFEALKLGVGKISHYLGTIVEQIAGDQEWESEMSSW
jgi:hypothetical protein